MRFRTAAALLLLSACGAPGAESHTPWQNTALRGTPEPPPPMVAVPAFPRLPVKRPVCIEREPGSDRIDHEDGRISWCHRGAELMQPMSALVFDLSVTGPNTLFLFCALRFGQGRRMLTTPTPSAIVNDPPQRILGSQF